MSEVLIQSTKSKTWCDADGSHVPFKFIPAFDKLKEKLAGSAIKEALKIEKSLADFHEKLSEDFEKVFNQMLKEYKLNYGKERKIKGAYT